MENLKVLDKDGQFDVNFSPGEECSRVLNVECILDLNQRGAVVGVEILNLKLEVGENALSTIKQCVSMTNKRARYSYDDEEDAFYLQLLNEPSKDQEAVDATIRINTKGAIIGFGANREGERGTH